jgi:hypothetical protein
MNKMTPVAAVQAHMTKVVLVLGVAATTLGLSTQADAACNIRGEHCGRPAWAANAFSNPRDRVPESALEPPKQHRAVRYSRPERTERVVKKPVREKVAEKIVPLVRFADGMGREFDPASKVWFDGRSQCWWGKEQFTFKNGDWFYGKKEWAEANGAWKVASGRSPELVSCESVPTFAAKANAIAAKSATQSSKLGTAESTDKGARSQTPPVTPRPVKIKTAESDPTPASLEPAPAAEKVCKKYFPSVGQMIAVPCTE